MLKSQAIIFDLDGTAIDSPDTQLPTARLTKALGEAESHYYLCAATGRVWSFAKPIIKALNLVDPCIVAAGTQICDPLTEEVLWQSSIEPAAMSKVVAVAKQLSDYRILYNDYDHDTYFSDKTMPTGGALDISIHFFGIIFVPQDKARGVMAKFTHIDGIAVTLALAQRPGYSDILITHKDATKEHAIAKLLKLIGVSQETTTGIGDGHNDLHIFEAVNHRVAMGNAVQELKDKADLVIDSVKDDGMAAYLEGLVTNF